jgi:hypothetical protein
MGGSTRATLGTLSLAFLTACVSSPIPEGYTGPTATIRDSARAESRSRAVFFYLAKIDGNAIKDSLAVTRQVNYGSGLSLTPKVIERKVPAKPLVLTLEGRTAYGAPIQEMFNSKTMYSADTAVEFEPAPDRVYVVTGILQQDRTEIWLADEATGERVGKVVQPK